MPVAKQKKHPTHIKRQGQHHKHGQHYKKVYWPYLPMLVVAIFGSLMTFADTSLRNQKKVLSYATEIGSSNLLSSTNDQRKANQKPTLVLNKSLSAAAQAKAQDMAKRNYWSHNTPDGQEPWVFIQKAGYAYDKAGENMAYGFTTSKDTISGWMNSPGHRANLLDDAYKDVGFGFINIANYQDSGAATIVVAEYGSPLNEAPGRPSNSATLSNSSKLTNSAKSSNPTVSSNSPDTSASNAVNSLRPVLGNHSAAVTRLQGITRGRSPTWSIFVLGLAGGAALTYLAIKHGLRFKKLILRSEALFIHHPFIDASLLALVFVSLYLSHTIGFIR